MSHIPWNLWCNTCQPLGGQHGSWASSSRYLWGRYWWDSKTGATRPLLTVWDQAGQTLYQLSYPGSAYQPFLNFKRSVSCPFFFNLEDFSPFCKTTDAPILDLWWHLSLALKPGWIPCSHALLLVCNGFLRFTCWPLDGQHCSQASLIHVLLHTQALVGLNSGSSVHNVHSDHLSHSGSVTLGVCLFCWNCVAYQKTERVGATESRVWIGHFNVKARITIQCIVP